MNLLTQWHFKLDEYKECIRGYAKENLTPAGCDLRAGKCQDLTTGQKVDLSAPGASYEIRHGDFVVIETKEEINLSGRDNIFGLVFSKVSFAIQGLSHVGTKIDPGFVGPLRLSFDNRGYEPIRITGETTVCNVALLEIDSTGSSYQRARTETLAVRALQPPIDLDQLDRALSQSNSALDEWYTCHNQWYSREALDVAKHLWRRLRKELKEQEESVKEANSRAEQVFIGAVIAIFLAVATAAGTLVAITELILKEVAGTPPRELTTVYLSIFSVFVLIVMLILAGVLRSHRRARRDS